MYYNIQDSHITVQLYSYIQPPWYIPI